MATIQTAIDPRYLPFDLWADAMRIQNPNFPRAVSESEWRIWAAQVCQFDIDAPDPKQYDNWRTWAQAWLRSV